MYSPIDFLHPIIFIVHPVVVGYLFVMYQGPVIVNPNKSLTFKIKLQQVLSIAELLIDSMLLITLKEHPNWIYFAKSNWKHWLSTRKFILSCKKFGNSQITHQSQNTGIRETLTIFC